MVACEDWSGNNQPECSRSGAPCTKDIMIRQILYTQNPAWPVEIEDVYFCFVCFCFIALLGSGGFWMGRRYRDGFSCHNMSQCRNTCTHFRPLRIFFHETKTSSGGESILPRRSSYPLVSWTASRKVVLRIRGISLMVLNCTAWTINFQTFRLSTFPEALPPASLLKISDPNLTSSLIAPRDDILPEGTPSLRTKKVEPEINTLRK